MSPESGSWPDYIPASAPPSWRISDRDEPMKLVFLPAVRLMRRLPMAHKFLIVCLCFAVPLVYLLACLAGDRSDARDFSAKELVGVAQVRQVSALLNAAMTMTT